MNHQWIDPLPYSKNALSFLSEEAVSLHHEKHQTAYATALDLLLQEDAAGVSEMNNNKEDLWQIVQCARGNPGMRKIFNNAGQLYNHNLYWKSFAPLVSAPCCEVLRLVARDFGSLEELKESLVNAGLAQFGSGWVWLVYEDGKLQVCTTANGDSPKNGHHIFAIDVWEHAYYVDYRQSRLNYLKQCCEFLNWTQAEAVFSIA